MGNRGWVGQEGMHEGSRRAQTSSLRQVSTRDVMYNAII